MAVTAAEVRADALTTADGVPLAVSMRRSMRRSRVRAFLLVTPLLLFLIVFFFIPIGDLMVYSVDDRQINDVFPRTFAIYDQWDGEALPGEDLYAALFEDLETTSKLKLGRASTRMNYEQSGYKSLIKSANRKFKKIKDPPYKEQMIEADKRWGDIKYWQGLGAMKDKFTAGYYLNAVDLRYDAQKSVIRQPENRRVYVMLWWRTLLVSFIVTVCCLLLGFPVSHLLATLPLRYSNLLMICVLLPFWTSLLVRITAWIVMLQQQGVINDVLVSTGLLNDNSRLPMMFNFTGTIIVMTQILLPFMILPVYSVMKTISPSYMRAAQNLGATPALAFWKVYVPQTLPGIGAGVLLVFIVAIGYFITPELVGGKDGQLIGNAIARHMKNSLNWGLASAMGVILLASILILYWLYDKIVGIDNMKLG
ncbi:MAG: ABC transporter permease [Gammaproteobacteria bacterium]